MDVRSLSNNELTFLNVAGQDNTYFTRLIAGHAGDPASSLSWRMGSALNLGMWDADNLIYSLVMHLSSLNRVGINTFDPEFTLDIRGLDDTSSGGEFQLATPGQTNFLRFFGGRLGDQHPFMAFTDTDTFHIVSTAPDWSTFSRKMTILPTGEVGIGTENPLATLDVEGTGDGSELLRFSTDRPWVFRQTDSGINSKLTLQSIINDKKFEILSSDSTNRTAVFHSNNAHSNVLLVPDGGEVGIGLNDPQAKLHVLHNSNSQYPQLRLTEDADDYARIKMESNLNPGAFWDIAGKADTITANSKLNFYFANSLSSGDRMTITGLGDVGIGIANPSARLDVLGGDYNLEAGNAGDLRIGTSTYNLRIGVATGGGGAGVSRIFAGGGVSELIFGTSNTRRMAIKPDGKVGIGIDNPAELLHVGGSFRVDGLSGTGDRNVIVDGSGKFKIGTLGVGDTDWNETSSHVISHKTARVVTVSGTPPFTTANYVDISAGSINKWSQIGGSSPYGSALNLQNDHNGDINMVTGGGQIGIGATAGGSKVTIEGPDNNGISAALEIRSSGSSQVMLIDGNEIDAATNMHLNANSGQPVSIGTLSIANGYKLSVAGKIIAEEVRVQLQGLWPDYVFEDDYALMPLEQVEASIKEQGHLPGIPAAVQIESDGLALGNMQTRMMEKIEELTLYMIELNNENKHLRQRIELLESSIDK